MTTSQQQADRLLACWRRQARMGIRPIDRTLPAAAHDRSAPPHHSPNLKPPERSNMMELTFHRAKSISATPGQSGSTAWIDVVVTDANGSECTVTLFLDRSARDKAAACAAVLNAAGQELNSDLHSDKEPA
jgi:hypothetical protein